jgi:hypothetical protein
MPALVQLAALAAVLPPLAVLPELPHAARPVTRTAPTAVIMIHRM